jgi:glycosyltransferase involved in cell wall biosynthesis
MRLLFLSNIFPNPYQPTRGIFNLALVRALAAEHEVRVVCPISWTDEWVGRSKRGTLLGPTRVENVEGVEVSFPRYLFTPKIFRRLYGSFMWQSVRGTVDRLIESFRPDGVIGYWAHPDGEAAVRAARLAGVPAVVMVGGTDVLLFTRTPARRRCIRNVLTRADAVVTVSRHLREKVLELGVEAAKAHVVERGVDTSLFRPGDRQEARRHIGVAPEGRVAVWVGRMHPVKGLDVLLDACAMLRSQRGDAPLPFSLYLVGDGPLRQSLEQAVTARGLTGVVHFAGQKTPSELPEWYRAADVTVLPSRSEGIPNVLRESLACGTPFVASDVGGVPELAASGAANRLVPAGDASALARAIRASLEHPCAPASVASPTADWRASARAVVNIIAGSRGAGAGGQKLRANRLGEFMSVRLAPDVASQGSN